MTTFNFPLFFRIKKKIKELKCEMLNILPD